jgi:hypothetical protein
MTGKTYQGTVVNGQIRLPANVELPEDARVLVILPDETEPVGGHVPTPRLAHPGQAEDSRMEVEVTK